MRHTRFESMEKYNFNPFGADYEKALQKINTPTLIIGGELDFIHQNGYASLKKTMKLAKVRVSMCPNGAHFTMWDDPENYFDAVNLFILEVDKGSFNPE